MEYYSKTGNPSNKSTGAAAAIRSEFAAIEAGFIKFPTLAGNGDEILVVDAGGANLATKTAAEVATLMGAELTTNKDAAAGYMGQDGFSPTITDITAAILSLLSNEATESRVWTLQDRDGTLQDDADMALKADIDSPTFTGAPLTPTPSVTDNSTRIANTEWYRDQFVSSLASSGYLWNKANGLVVQWGSLYAGTSPSYETITFPTAFTTFWGIVGSNRSAATAEYSDIFWFTNPTTTTCRAYSTAGRYISWFAIGYKTPA